MDDLVHSPSSSSSLKKPTSIDRSTFVSMWVSLGEISVKVWLVSINLQVQVGEGNLLACQTRVGAPRTYSYPKITTSSLPSNSLAKGCSQTMSLWTVSYPKKCGPSICLFPRYTALGFNYHTSFALGTVQVQESGGREASDQSNIHAPYLTYQLCGYEGQKLYNTSPMSTAPRGKWMDDCRGWVCPSPVSTNQHQLPSWDWANVVARHLARVTALARRTTSPVLPQFRLQQPSWLQDDSRWKWWMTIAGGWTMMTLSEDNIFMVCSMIDVLYMYV
jgi:hypothetical protein